MTDAAPDHAAAHLRAAADRARIARRSLAIASGRLLLATTLAMAGIIGYPGHGAELCLVASALTVILGGWWLDALERRVRTAARLVEYHRSGIERLAGRWGRRSETGAAEAGAAHPYAHDLGVVGERSLFTLIDTSASRSGRALLLEWLLDESGEPEAEKEREVRWLVQRPEWRADFHAAGLEAQLQSHDHLAAWMLDAVRPSSWLRWGIICLRATYLLVLALSALRWDMTGTALIALVLIPISIPIDMLALRWLRALGDRDALVRSVAHERRLARQLSLLPVEAGAPASLTELVRLARVAGPALETLEAICETLAKRSNPIWAYGVGAVMLAEWRSVERLDRWSRAHASERGRWLAALARIDALSCLATYAAEQGGCWPQWTLDGPVLMARALAHPLLPRQSRVGNSMSIERHDVLVITGANASGKSTFLRASLLGVVLARLGVTVPADEFRLRPMRLATVMAVHDDVMQGISRFQAEVGRLKQVLDLASSRGLPVLVALDEPLSGTNSVERHLGTVAVAMALARLAAGVLISTHDLALADLGQQADLSVQVVHFSDHAAESGSGSTLAFDYLMRPGVLQTTNALRIMRLAGLPVPETAGRSAAGAAKPVAGGDGAGG